jgi:hypothetical protein
MKVLYRYVDHCDTLLLEEHRVVRETPCGAWVRDPYAYPEKLRFVNLTKVKQFACPTKEAAKVSFLARKKRQLAIMKARIGMIEDAVERLNAGEIGEQYSSFDL